ncbi:putative GPI anchored protein [Aspergillus novofumigatus IBT 16806]|uniref:F-box domain protein n=1 Tax=Aspergillus novofumigatus (strain IBT 16806) TaxID=1392255 RepID=A0A2I1CF40_ASPN1|nr:F-box domain protein [Aspergillus novofumigatus IBT 16806]PKX96242.1 F-box domain protein [Aspergillus novofumigatus IBT 16806]
MLLLLPYELQLKVIDSISPKDLPSFSSSCKYLQELCRNHLREHKKYRKWQSEVLCSLTPSNIRPCRTNEAFGNGAPRLLLEIAQSPRLAPYVEELSPEPFDCSQDLCSVWDLSLQWIKRLAQASRIVEEEEVCDWMHAVATGTGGATLALALGQLAELKTMELEVNAYDTILPYVPRGVSRLATRSYRGLQDQPLSSLTDVRVNFLSYDHDEEEGDDESYGSESSEDRREQRLQAVLGEDHFQQIIRLLTALARLPALKTSLFWQEDMSAQSSITYDWDDAMDPAYPLPPANSGLESVVVDRGNISGRALSRIIDGCSSLRQFKYMVFHTPEVFGQRLGGVQYRSPLSDMSIEAVCIALLIHAKFSLRHLHIELTEYGSICGCRHEPCLKPNRPYMSINPIAPPTTNWRWNEFSRLERLTLDIDLFSNLEGNGWLPFAQTLPASIQDVVILARRCPPGADTLDFQNMFRDFNPQSFPNLRSISAWHRNHQDSAQLGHNGAEHILAVYRLALERAGIRAEGNTEYALGSDYFAKRKKAYCHWSRGIRMNQFGMDDYDLYALPETDLNGRVVFGVYHADSSGDIYTGITMKKA